MRSMRDFDSPHRLRKQIFALLSEMPAKVELLQIVQCVCDDVAALVFAK